MSLCPRAPFARLALLGALAAVLGLAGCGRKGPLAPPPSAAVAQPTQSAAAPGSGVNPMARSTSAGQQAFDPDGRPVAPAGSKKRLPIDWLLD